MHYDLLRSLLFRFDPETAHHLSLTALRQLARLGALNPVRQALPPKSLRVMGLEFPNPVGLAAGLDKNGDCIDGMAALGFGFLEIGTVTPKPQPGNPRPRLFRLVEQEALINRLGFNNLGVEHLVERVKARRSQVVLGINIGKNVFTPVENALDDYRLCLRQVYAHADYVTVNISSPNTPGLRTLQLGESLNGLLAGLAETREELADEHGRRVPLAVKIAPDLADEDLPELAETLLKNGVDAVIATNTTLDRSKVQGSPYAQEAGGLSGRPLLERSTAVVARLAEILRGELPIVACGGIFGAADAQAKFAAGAALVQVYSGFIYRGPDLIREIVESLPER
ncbi:quinone-dependent dihydroorotate dehydrogenase [Methylococcus sp. EFPC2]|uniref:quinone-dependent dihydroorotate dehydrogenase n=1 Tax=Methylococcus sp. EFPC2 TaxID=2812648 RepID=UPI00196721E1|nr:quinone-dependent dihydroorotate dehydrogenase [Methylococcus sp. EFPC2]QSA96128.1 quinone-dependent dihydroorotate dehydrogenase [Methylococcus sp. EFPC2]